MLQNCKNDICSFTKKLKLFKFSRHCRQYPDFVWAVRTGLCFAFIHEMAAAMLHIHCRCRVRWRHSFKVKIYLQTKFRPDILILGWDITTSASL